MLGQHVFDVPVVVGQQAQTSSADDEYLPGGLPGAKAV
jgi:hypothetical protein